MHNIELKYLSTLNDYTYVIIQQSDDNYNETLKLLNCCNDYSTGKIIDIIKRIEKRRDFIAWVGNTELYKKYNSRIINEIIKINFKK